MREVSMQDFCRAHISIRFINSLRQYWRRTTRFSCIGVPKKQNILVYFCGCVGVVHTKSGEVIEIEENGIMYAPQGAEYEVEIHHRREGGYTVGANFLLIDEQGESVVFSEDVLSFPSIETARRPFAILDGVGDDQMLYSRILLETVIHNIVQDAPAPSVPAIIQSGVTYLLEHYTESPSIAQLAEMCHISEVYFRRLFKRTFAVSPAAYITRLKLKKAAEYLEYGEMSVQEIAETVGYAGAAYFSKEFKATYGVTPLRYRRDKCISR